MTVTILRRYVVIGRVQGVGFRWFVEREARLAGITGWVRNRDDGSVEVLASASEAQHAELRRKLAEGPRASRVDEVQELEPGAGEAAELGDEFQIRGAW
jgi:acylphosphatase